MFVCDQAAGLAGRLDRRTAFRVAGGAALAVVAGCPAPRSPRLLDRVPDASFLVGVDGAIAGDPETAELLTSLTEDGAPPTDVFGSQTGLDFARVRELLIFDLGSPEALAPAEADVSRCRRCDRG